MLVLRTVHDEEENNNVTALIYSCPKGGVTLSTSHCERTSEESGMIGGRKETEIDDPQIMLRENTRLCNVGATVPKLVRVVRIRLNKSRDNITTRRRKRNEPPAGHVGSLAAP